MSLEAIVGAARRHLKRGHVRHLARQISLVDCGVRTGTICGPPQPHIGDLRNLLRQLHLAKVVSDGCTLVAFHDEVCIVNLAKIRETFTGKLPVFVEVSDKLPQPEILPSAASKIQQFLTELKEKITGIQGESVEFSPQVSLSAVLGFLAGFPVIYWCESEGNCLSMVPLRQFRTSIDQEEVFSFTVPEILLGDSEIQEILSPWRSSMRNAGVKVEESVHQEPVVIL